MLYVQQVEATINVNPYRLFRIAAIRHPRLSNGYIRAFIRAASLFLLVVLLLLATVAVLLYELVSEK